MGFFWVNRRKAWAYRQTSNGWSRPSRSATQVRLSIPRPTRRKFRSKPGGKNPEHAVFSPDGKWFCSSAEEAHQIEVGERPRGIGFAPGGKMAFAASQLMDTVCAIEIGKRAIAAVIPGGQFSDGITLHPDGARDTCQTAGTERFWPSTLPAARLRPPYSSASARGMRRLRGMAQSFMSPTDVPTLCR
jgi:hypothetical protein